MKKPPRRRCPNEQAFVERALQHLERGGITVRFHRRRYLQPDSMSGYFSWTEKTLDVALRAKSWFHIFVHEYAHFLQALQGRWLDERPWLLWSRWMRGSLKLTHKKARTLTRTLAECELDAERKTIALAQTHNFTSFNIESYTRGSNIYALAHEAARLTGKWFKRYPTRSPAMLRLVPAELIRERDVMTMPPGFLDKYLEFC